jgi:hypothetical protein
MKTRTSLRAMLLLGCVAVAAPAPAQAVDPRGAPGTTAASGAVVVVQALPGSRVRLSIDGHARGGAAAVGAVLGPFDLSPGAHRLTFADAGADTVVRTRLMVRPGSSSDVVLHRPASVDGAPVVNTYRTPSAPLGPDKARILLAHTATVAPADVRFDGQVVFTNIANGEFADADVPAGAHRVALLPTGLRRDPILGPLAVSLAPRTVSMVYAVGSPRNGSMQAIVHTVRVAADGSVVPRTIDTGSAGLVARLRVRPFALRTSLRSSAGVVAAYGAARAR